MTTLTDRVRAAIADPGSVVGNRIHTSFGDDHDETVPAWSTRAVMTILDGRDDAAAVFSDILTEAAQTHITYRGLPNGTGEFQAIIDADCARMVCDDAEDQDYFSWTYLLRAAALEAIATTKPDQLRANLATLAATATAWIADLDEQVPARPIETIKVKGALL